MNYWLFGGQTSNLTVDNVLSQPESKLVNGVTSPYVVTSLTNGSIYSFLMNANTGTDKAGPPTAAVSVTPMASGYTWANGAPMSAANIYGQAFNAGTYLAVGAGGAALTSSDGVTWTARSTGTANDLYAAVYTSSLAAVYIAVGANGTIVTSPDGVTWTPQASGTTNTLRAITQNGSQYVAVGDSGTVLTSTNGWQWTLQPQTFSTNLYGITYDTTNTTFYAVGQGGALMSSLNAGQWTQLTSTVTQDLYSIAVGNSVFVAVGANGTILQSADGVTWAAQGSPTTENLYSVTYGSQFAAVGGAGVALNGTTAGNTWSFSTQGTGTASDLRSVSFEYYRLLALGTGGANTLSY